MPFVAVVGDEVVAYPVDDVGFGESGIAAEPVRSAVAVAFGEPQVYVESDCLSDGAVFGFAVGAVPDCYADGVVFANSLAFVAPGWTAVDAQGYFAVEAGSDVVVDC